MLQEAARALATSVVVEDSPCEDCECTCEAKNHNNIKEFAPYTSDYWKKTTLKTKTRKPDHCYPLECYGCKKTFAIKSRGAPDATHYLVTDTRPVRACTDAMDPKKKCMLAYCTPCWEQECGYGKGKASPRKGKGEREATFAATYFETGEI